MLSGKRGIKEVVAFVRQLRQYTTNGIAFTIVEMTAEDDRVAAEPTGAGEMVDGSPYNNVYHMLFYLRGGKICRVKEYMDTRLVDAAVGPHLANAAR